MSRKLDYSENVVGKMHIIVRAYTLFCNLLNFFSYNIAPSPPTDVTAVQDGLTSIRMTWTPSSGATGYRIDYNGGSSDSETVSGGDTNSHTLTGLTNGETYSISIVAISDHFFSDSVFADISLTLGERSVKTGFLYKTVFLLFQFQAHLRLLL